jgi:serine/threonine-protein kinase HipA
MAQLADVLTMLSLVRQVEDGEPVAEPLRRLITPGATLGGARPKALLQIDGAPWVVKFAEAGDPLDSPLIEHAAMTLAAKAGIDACETRAIPIANGLADGHALAIRRSDRAGGTRVTRFGPCRVARGR